MHNILIIIFCVQKQLLTIKHDAFHRDSEPCENRYVGLDY